MAIRRIRPLADQRRPDNLFTSMLVDIAVTYQRVFGHSAARDFLRTHRVPPTVADRIISQESVRRLTRLERSSKPGPAKPDN